MTVRRRILLIEDEESISEPLGQALGREGFDVVVAATAAAGRERFREDGPDLVLLDVMLPDGDGRDLLREFRSTSRTPVVMLTARGEEVERVLGLELGADDYVTKPFSAAELAARVRAVLRRADQAPAEAPGAALEIGDVRMNLERHDATHAGEPLELTVKEYELLRMLLEHAGRVVKREQLIREVWDTSWFGSTKTLDVHVSALRRKLGDDPAAPRYIHTVRGVGFRFAAPEELSMSFRTRLVLAAFYVLTAVVLALVIPLALTVERRAESDFRSAVLGDAAVLAARVADDVPEAQGRVAAIVNEGARDPTRRIVVVDESGNVVADSAGQAPVGTPFASEQRPELRVALFQGRIDTRKRASETVGDELQLVTVPVVDEGRVVGAVRVSASTSAIQESVRGSWLRLAILGTAVIGAGLVLAWLLAVPLSRQIRSLSDASTRLGRGDLAARAPEEGPTELEALARSFNRMAASVGGNIEAQREFAADASHQLRTPLTGLRLRLEAIRGEGGFAAEQAAKAEAELDRLDAIVDHLLALARASSRDSTAVPVDLADLARDAAGRWRETAEAAGQRVELDTRGSPVAWADREDLVHVLDNLIDNAIRYAPAGSEVRVEAERRDGAAVLVVADTGPGIPPEDRTRVFDRFYRGTTGRQAGPGSGLGLAIVAALVERWGGEVRLLDGPGTRVEALFRPPPT